MQIQSKSNFLVVKHKNKIIQGRNFKQREGRGNSGSNWPIGS
jgi:hypothetical protein